MGLSGPARFARCVRRTHLRPTLSGAQEAFRGGVTFWGSGAPEELWSPSCRRLGLSLRSRLVLKFWLVCCRFLLLRSRFRRTEHAFVRGRTPRLSTQNRPLAAALIPSGRSGTLFPPRLARHVTGFLLSGLRGGRFLLRLSRRRLRFGWRWLGRRLRFGLRLGLRLGFRLGLRLGFGLRLSCVFSGRGFGSVPVGSRRLFRARILGLLLALLLFR